LRTKNFSSFFAAKCHHKKCGKIDLGALKKMQQQKKGSFRKKRQMEILLGSFNSGLFFQWHTKSLHLSSFFSFQYVTDQWPKSDKPIQVFNCRSLLKKEISDRRQKRERGLFFLKRMSQKMKSRRVVTLLPADWLVASCCKL
jgi:hypothetical protein